MKWLDLPPIWLALFAVIVWLLRDAGPGAPEALRLWITAAGGVLIGAGVILLALAIRQMMQHRTTVIPHQEARALVTSGVFGLSRNPIYLGDAFALAGWTLICGAPILLFGVPLFMWLISRRFILPEEARLAASFGAEFDAYRTQTRRWI